MKERPKQYDLRSRLLFNIFLDSAVRIGEITRLSLSSLDIENNIFTDIKQKGGDAREVNFLDETKMMILEYLEWREKIK